MNTRTLVSLVVGLAAGLAFGYLAAPAAKPPALPLAAAPSAEAKAAPAASAPKPRTLTQIVTNTIAQKFDWNSVESDDYKKYIANLRSIGCPEETIRDIITADVNKLYDAKRKALAGPKKKFEFWKAA